MKCPNSWKKKYLKYPQKFEKIQSPKIEKCRTKKKIRAFHIHSNMSRHEMPKQLEKSVLKYPPTIEKIQCPKIEKCRTKKKLGHSTSTQTRVDTKCPNSWKKNILGYPPKFEKNTKCQNRKMSGQKKRRAFRIHSNMSKHETPKQLKKPLWNIPKN